MRVHNQAPAKPTADDRLQEVKAEFSLQAQPSVNGDQRIQAFFRGFSSAYETYGYDEIFATTFQQRPELRPPHAAQLAARAIWKQALRRARSIGYPQRFTDPEPWRELAREIASDSVYRAEFAVDMATRNVQSNLSERYKSIKLLALMMGERFGGEGVRILDIGCSENQGLKKLALNHAVGLSFKPVKVYHDEYARESEPHLEPDPVAEEYLNALLAAGKMAVGASLGIDKEPADRPDVMEWVKACSFYPSELLDMKRHEEFDLIELSRPPMVSFKQVDIFDVACQEVMDEVTGRYGRFDIVMFSTMQYQLNERQRQMAPQIAERYVDPDNGLVVSQEFATIDPDDRTRLSFFEHWGPYTYQTVVKDMQRADELQQIFIWKNGRTQELQLGAGRLCLKGAARPIREILVPSRTAA